MWPVVKLLPVESFTFCNYVVDPQRSIVTFTYRVKFKFGLVKTFTDRLFLTDVKAKAWNQIPKEVLEPTLQALLLMLGINYWSAFPTRNKLIEGFALTQDQANFWNDLYLNGLGEFFYLTKIDFRNLINFPYTETEVQIPVARFKRPNRSLLLNGAGKDSLLSAEILKAEQIPFDFFAFSPTPAHERTADLVGAKTIKVKRRRDPWLNLILTGAYPSVSTFTFVATLLAELLGYDSIIFSNEKSADVGNLEYLGLSINHQWCKSSSAEKMINNYIQTYITPDISTRSLLREYSEIEIVQRFVNYPKYLRSFTSCNTYFWLPRIQQILLPKNYWCGQCPKCVFLFACFSAFLPKSELISIFGDNLYQKKSLLPLFERILGVKGFKPLDCVGEPAEMILAMHYASQTNEYTETPAMRLFRGHFPMDFDFTQMERLIYPSANKDGKDK